MMSQPEMLFVLGLLAALVVHACVVQRTVRRQRADLLRLNTVLTRCTREHLNTMSRTLRAERDADRLVSRLDAIECRSSGGQRIESAVAVARQGAANPEVLKDLGLSESEASLLLRLQVKPSADESGAPATRAAPPAPMAEQAASLAKLLAARPKTAA